MALLSTTPAVCADMITD